jgi:XTP/dITP diphosphohydrolase
LARSRFLLATRNQGKIREIKNFLADLPIEIIGQEDIFPDLICPEHGKTFLENARAKCLCVSGKWDGFVLGEDSGLEIDALDGAPGIFSARFSGAGSTDEKNIRKVLRLLRHTHPENRKARFVCTMALAARGRIVKEIRGEVRGRITLEPKGSGGFGYDPIFYYPPLRKTFADLETEEKSGVSHRGRALWKLKKYLGSHSFPG